MTHDDPGRTCTTRPDRPTTTVLGPAYRPLPEYTDSPPDGFRAEDCIDPQLRLWFVDDDDEAGRIDDALDVEYDGELEPEIEATIDDVADDTEGRDGDRIDFDTLSIRLYVDLGLQRLVRIPP